jgi:MFS family permease
VAELIRVPRGFLPTRTPLGGAGGLVGGRLVDRFGTRPVFLFAGTVGAGAIALASYQHDLLMFALL